jgi:hypothetical protein
MCGADFTWSKGPICAQRVKMFDQWSTVTTFKISKTNAQLYSKYSAASDAQDQASCTLHSCAHSRRAHNLQSRLPTAQNTAASQLHKSQQPRNDKPRLIVQFTASSNLHKLLKHEAQLHSHWQPQLQRAFTSNHSTSPQNSHELLCQSASSACSNAAASVHMPQATPGQQTRLSPCTSTQQGHSFPTKITVCVYSFHTLLACIRSASTSQPPGDEHRKSSSWWLHHIAVSAKG